MDGVRRGSMDSPRLIALLVAPVASALGSLRSWSSLRRAAGLASGSVRAVAFWAAVSLPFVHAALLVRGLDSTADLLAVAVLLGANLLALLVGHGYGSR